MWHVSFEPYDFPSTNPSLSHQLLFFTLDALDATKKAGLPT